MTNIANRRVERMVIAWIQFVERNHISVIIMMMMLTLFSVFYIKNNLGMNTNTTDMLSAELPWRKLDIQYEKLFPQFLDNVLIVIEAKTPDQASDAAKQLYAILKSEPTLINDIYYPSQLPYFRQSAFLFLETDELQDLADRLAAIQPFLGTLLNDKNLRGLFNMLSEALQARQDGEEIDLKPLLLEINRAFEDQTYSISWQHLMATTKERKSVYREFIVLQTLEADDEVLPGETVIAHIRSSIDKANLDDNINIRLTGGTVLSYEELKSVAEINTRAIVMSFILVAIILIIGLGSGWLVITCLITLLTGLIVTTAFAAVTIGELNLISVAFAVLYIGLGIDFAIHLTLRYREKLLLEVDHALPLAVAHIFRSLILCAITTAIGFYAFIPTAYKGVAELGWIAGSGIFISMLFTFTLLPALLSLRTLTFQQRKKRSDQAILMRLINLPYRYSELILLMTLIIIIVMLTQIGKLGFDTNTLNLKNPDQESVQTYRDLLNDSDTSPWSSVLLKKEQAIVQAAKQELEQLELVDSINWLEDFLPSDQEEKLLIIDEVVLLMGVLETTISSPVINAEVRIQSINKLKRQLENFSDRDLTREIDMLKLNLTDLLNRNATANELIKLEEQMLKNLDGRIESLADALNAETVNIENIPPEVHDRWFSNGYYKMEISPKDDLNDNVAMNAFVKQLQSYDSDVIGSSVISIEAGDAVINAFKSAFSYAFVAITLLLFFLISIKRDAIIILASVLVGGVFTFGLMVLFNIPLNFANIIGLPLLLGIGVDSSIHIVNRFRQEQGLNKNIFTNSSYRGVFVSSLTTICSIGNLAFSSHQGTASMGLLLTVGLVSMMITTMLILPAFLVWQASSKKQA